jgi:ketosteroid isomerase-like protein
VSEQNIQFVQSLYAAFGAGDIKAIIKASSADVVWEIVGRASDFPVFGRRTGLEGVAEFFQALYENEQIESFTPQAFHTSGDKVIVEGHAASVLKGSDRHIDSDWLHIFTMKDGKLVAFKEFYDTAQCVA